MKVRFIMKYVLLLKNFLFILSLLLMIPSSVQCFEAKCKKILDAKNIHVWYDSTFLSRRMKVQLYGINVADKKTKSGMKAKSFLVNNILGKMINIQPMNRSFSGWTQALIFLNKNCVNEELISQGLVGIDTKECSDQICAKWIKIMKNINKN